MWRQSLVKNWTWMSYICKFSLQWMITAIFSPQNSPHMEVWFGSISTLFRAGGWPRVMYMCVCMRMRILFCAILYRVSINYQYWFLQSSFVDVHMKNIPSKTLWVLPFFRHLQDYGNSETFQTNCKFSIFYGNFPINPNYIYKLWVFGKMVL